MRNSPLARLMLLAGTGAALAACRVPNKERGDFVISSLPLSTTTTTGTSCQCPDPSSAKEASFVYFSTQFLPCMVVENRLQPNNTGPGRINTNDLILENLHVSYEANVADQNIPVNGTIPANSKVSVPVLIVPPNLAPALPAGVIPNVPGVRAYVYAEGRLLDGTKVRTSTYEYILYHCVPNSLGCGAGACNGP